MNIVIKKADFCTYGVMFDGVDFVFSTPILYLRTAGIKLYNSNHKLVKNIPFSQDFAYGNVFCVKISGLTEGMLYRYYSDETEYPDPYGNAYEGIYPYGYAHDEIYSVIRQETYPVGWEKDVRPHIPYSDSFLYLCHVRGFTKKDYSDEVGGTFSCMEKRIQYLKKLGVTGLVLLPTYEFNENVDPYIPATMEDAKRHCKDLVTKSGKVNYWGFVNGFYFAKKRGYSYSEDANLEYRHFVLALHKHNIECIETIFFPEDITMFDMLKVLEHEKLEYHVDGFRFVGKVVPKEILSHPLLSDMKLICEHSDVSFLRDKQIKEKNIALIDDSFLNSARRFLKGDEDQVSSMAYKLKENPTSYQMIRNMTDYNGFSLYDLVSYNRKHNENNLEGNEDGTNYNYSWNCGEEGDATKRSTQKLRMIQMRNAFLLLMLSQGTPMISMGDECMLSHLGNNNPWCQDNEVNYFSLPKSAMQKELFSFVASLWRFRKDHPLLHIPGELKMVDYMSCKIPDLSFHGEEPWKINQNPDSREFSYLYYGAYEKQYTKKDGESLWLIFNMFWEEKSFPLPIQDERTVASVVCVSDKGKDAFTTECILSKETDTYIAKPRTISIIVFRKK